MSELAKQLIAENKLTRGQFLDLGRCGLTEIPAEVGELVWLEEVSFASEWHEWNLGEVTPRRTSNKGDENAGLTDIGLLAGLPALRSLRLNLSLAN